MDVSSDAPTFTCAMESGVRYWSGRRRLRAIPSKAPPKTTVSTARLMLIEFIASKNHCGAMRVFSTARLAAQHFLHTQFFDSPLCLFAEVGFADLDDHLANLAGELVIAHLVVVADGRIEVHAHVRCFRAKRIWMSVLDAPFGDILTIDEDRPVTPRAGPATVVSKLEAERH